MWTDRGPLEATVRFYRSSFTCASTRGVRRGLQAGMWIIRSQRQQPFLRVETGSGHSTGMECTLLIQRFPFSLQRSSRRRRGRDYPGCNLVWPTVPTGCVWRLHQPITSLARLFLHHQVLSPGKYPLFWQAHGPLHYLSFSLDSSYS